MLNHKASGAKAKALPGGPTPASADGNEKPKVPVGCSRLSFYFGVGARQCTAPVGRIGGSTVIGVTTSACGVVRHGGSDEAQGTGSEWIAL